MEPVISDYLESVLAKIAGNTSGSLAAAPEELGVEDPDLFGISLTMSDGNTYEAGDTLSAFSIQSVSKPFTYGMALTDYGLDAVRKKIDVEPSGDAYNEISLEEDSGRPRNAMINAGAIAAASLVSGHSGDDAFERMRRTFSAYAGRELNLDRTVYESAQLSGDRNRAIAYLLKSQGIIEHDVEAGLDLYFRQNSLSVTCRDLGIMAATLANRGTNPVTGEEVLPPRLAEHVLSVMTTCGMYNDAGDWVAGIGLPAKSGISGGILAVLPGQLGLAVFSPRLDPHGNSVRGTQACRRLSEEMELHFIHASRSARSTIRADYSLATKPSPRVRPPQDLEVLADRGHMVRFLEVHGDMLFPEAETVIRTATDLAASHDVIVIDISRLDDVSPSTRALFLRLQETSDHGLVVFVDPGQLLSAGTGSGGREPGSFTSLDAAARWCEDHVIGRYAQPPATERGSEPAGHPVTADLPKAGRDTLAGYLKERTYGDGHAMIPEGTSEPGLFLLMTGQARWSTTAEHGEAPAHTRIFTPGTSFGRLGTSNALPPRTMVHAAGPASALVLTPEAYVRLRREHPQTALLLAERLLDIAARQQDLDRAATA